jgi:hypothetical protein
MAGNGVPPSISTGTRPLNACSGSSTGCAAFDRLATHRMMVSFHCRRYAKILRLPGWMKRSVPRPKAWVWRRCASMRRVQFSKECGSRCWASTLTAS